MFTSGAANSNPTERRSSVLASREHENDAGKEGRDEKGDPWADPTRASLDWARGKEREDEERKSAEP